MKKIALMLLVPALIGLRGAAPSAALTNGEAALLYDSYSAETKGDVDAAISRMVILLGTQPDDYLVNYRLGWLFSRAKKYKNSIDHYERAARAAPSSLEPWLALSSLYLSLGYSRQALEVSTELLNRDPKNYYGLLRLAAARQSLKNYEGALATTDEALKLYAMDTLLLEKKAFLLKQLGKKSESRETLEQLLLLSPQNAYAKSELKR